MFTHHHASDCTCCSARGTVERPSSLWKVALVAGYVVVGLMVAAASMLGLGILGVIPLLMMAGLGLLPFLHDRAGAPPLCSACGKISEGTVAREVARPAPQGAVARAS